MYSNGRPESFVFTLEEARDCLNNFRAIYLHPDFRDKWVLASWGLWAWHIMHDYLRTRELKESWPFYICYYLATNAKHRLAERPPRAIQEQVRSVSVKRKGGFSSDFSDDFERSDFEVVVDLHDNTPKQIKGADLVNEVTDRIIASLEEEGLQ